MSTTEKLAILNLEGTLEQGFRVSLQIWSNNNRRLTEISSHLPADLELATRLTQWRQSYRNLGDVTNRIKPKGITHTGSINRVTDCLQSQKRLQQQFSTWLAAQSFQSIDKRLREVSSREETIRILICTNDVNIRHLPWHLWDFIERYPKAEVALSTSEFDYIERAATPSAKVKILAILGSSIGINIDADRQLLESLPSADVTFLVECQRYKLNHQLWNQPWDILFFAGHSETEEEQGRIYINSTESLTLEELRYGLKQAIAQGLQLAIFNSCDGLGLIHELEQLQIPQLIVMREPVPDRMAQEFLKQFLKAYADGKSLALSVRQAREQLQGWEGEFPCASWLPVLWQHPMQEPPTWQSLWNRRAKRKLSWFRWRKLRWKQVGQVLIWTALMTTLLVTGTRLCGILQPLELAAFDQMMRLRPDEGIDPNLLIIEITNADIQRQKQNGERMQRTSTSAQSQGQAFDVSLSDQSLNQLLNLIKKYQPAVIGLDLLRDFPVDPNVDELRRQFQTLPITAICKAENYQDESISSVDPPPEIPIDPDLNRNQIGFNDFLFDNDSILRRHLLSLYPQLYRNSNCTTNYAFSTQVAFTYLKQQGTNARFVHQGDYDDLQLGNKLAPVLRSRMGVYQQPAQEWGGNQILLNYRAGTSLAYHYTLNEILHGHINPDYIRNKIVLIGVSADTQKDNWNTPYGKADSKQMPGVYVHAQMISQLVNAALKDRPLLRFWSFQQDMFWILGWSVVGGVIVWSLSLVGRVRKRSLLQLGGISIAAGILYSLCFKMLLIGIWAPLVPALFGLILSGSAVWLNQIKQIQRSSKLYLSQ